MIIKYLRAAGISQSNYIDYTNEIAVDKSAHFTFYISNVRWCMGNLFTVILLIGSVAAVINKKIGILVVLFFSYTFILLIGTHKAEIYNMHYILIALPGFFLGGVYGMIVIFDCLRKCLLSQNIMITLRFLALVMAKNLSTTD